MIQPQNYVRRPFPVVAVRVTLANMFDVANWCKGEVVTNKEGTKNHIDVEVHRPNSPRQTTAFPGDWVVKTENGSSRVYSNKTFHANFVSDGGRRNLVEASDEIKG